MHWHSSITREAVFLLKCRMQEENSGPDLQDILVLLRTKETQMFLHGLRMMNMQEDLKNIIQKDVTGGWYDAGDHGKYVVNGGIAVWTLMNMYERAKIRGIANQGAYKRRWNEHTGEK